MGFEDSSDGLFDRIGPDLLGVDVGLWLLKPIKVLLEEDEAIGSLLDQIVVLAQMAFLVPCLSTLVIFSQNLESPSQISLLGLMLAILIILIRQLVDDSLPFLEKFGCK